MAKGGGMTPKALANKMKAKGLQKLRWYCQMCEKQCRDENGFKCHIMSESHARQMSIFAQDPSKFMNDFSRQFEKGYMSQLKRCHQTSKVFANQVYQEYIADKEHIHMNATHWPTLTDFVLYLGKTGKVEVTEDERGYWVRYIDRDPARLAKLESAKRMERAELGDEEKIARRLRAQQEEAMRIARERGEDVEEDEDPSARLLVRDDNAEKLSLTLDAAKGGEAQRSNGSGAVVFGSGKKRSATDESRSESAKKARNSNLQSLMERDQATSKKHDDSQRSSSSRKPSTSKVWIREGLIVKVLHKELAAGEYYKQKGRIGRVIEKKESGKVSAEIEMAKSGDVIRVEQSYLETVLPAIGGNVCVVRGELRGVKGTMDGVDTKRFKCTIRFSNGETEEMDYDDVCKLKT